MTVVSFDPDDMVEGGVLDEGNARITDAKFVIWDYAGKHPEARATFAALTFVTDEGKEGTQYYRAASLDKFVPTSDGRSLTGVAGSDKLRKDTNFAFLTAKMKEIGVPLGIIQAGDIFAFVGLYAVWVNAPAPERDFKNQPKRDPGTIYVPAKVLELPGGGKAAGTSRKAPKGAGSQDVVGAATEYVKTLLSEKGGKVSRKAANTLTFSRLAKNPLQAEIAKLVADDTFIESLAEDGIAFDGTQLLET